jgi:hypothetical protein
MADPRFDVNAARLAGWSDRDIASYLKANGMNPAEQFFYAPLPRDFINDPTANLKEVVRDSQGSPIEVYEAYQPAGPEAGRFKLRVPRRREEEDDPYRGLSGFVREYSPGLADVLAGLGDAAVIASSSTRQQIGQRDRARVPSQERCLNTSTS